MSSSGFSPHLVVARWASTSWAVEILTPALPAGPDGVDRLRAAGELDLEGVENLDRLGAVVGLPQRQGVLVLDHRRQALVGGVFQQGRFLLGAVGVEHLDDFRRRPATRISRAIRTIASGAAGDLESGSDWNLFSSVMAVAGSPISAMHCARSRMAAEAAGLWANSRTIRSYAARACSATLRRSVGSVMTSAIRW